MDVDRSVDLATERIDLAVRITNSLETTMIARALATCRSVLCAAPACLRAQGAPSSLEAVLRRAVLEGSGIGILPTYLVGDDLRQGRLVHVLPALEPKTPGIHAIFLSRQHQPLALRLLVGFLAQRFGGPAPPWGRPPVVKRQCKLA